jgi:hypothetical protein
MELNNTQGVQSNIFYFFKTDGEINISYFLL